MTTQNKLESAMDEYFVKKAPFQLPENGRRTLVEYAPWISLVFGILGILAALGLWRIGNRVNEAVEYVNGLNQYYNTPAPEINELGLFFYIALLALAVQAVLMIAAFPGLKKRSKKTGWDFMLYGTLASLAYGFFVIFSDQGDIGNLLWSVIGSVISLYLLAQVRTYYKDGKSHEAILKSSKKVKSPAK